MGAVEKTEAQVVVEEDEEDEEDEEETEEDEEETEGDAATGKGGKGGKKKEGKGGKGGKGAALFEEDVDVWTAVVHEDAITGSYNCWGGDKSSPKYSGCIAICTRLSGFGIKGSCEGTSCVDCATQKAVEK